MMRATMLGFCVVGLLFLSTPPLAAADLLEIVPGDALGFVVVNRPADIDAKIGNLGEKMQLPRPLALPVTPPMAMLKATTGIGPGTDDSRPSAIVVMPGQDADALPVPLWYVPISDFDEFTASLDVDDLNTEDLEPKIFELYFKDRSPCLAGKAEGYAVLAEYGRQDVLKKVLSSKTTLPDVVRQLQPWIEKRDVAAVVTPKGIRLITDKLREGLAMVRVTLEQELDQGNANPVAEALKIYDKLFQAVDDEVTLAAWGLQLDESGDVRIFERFGFRPGGAIAKAVECETFPPSELLAGIPGGPFVFAGGGVISPAAVDAMLGFSMDMMKAAHKMYGLSPEQAEEMMAAAGPMMRQMRGMCMLFAVGAPDETLYSKMLVGYRVGNAPKFIGEYASLIENMRELAAGNDESIFAGMESKPIEIAGLPGLEVVMDMSANPMIEQVPEFDKMMEKFVGPGGKVRIYLVAADEHLVLLGYTDQRLIKQALATLQASHQALTDQPMICQVAEKLPAGVAGVVYISPAGIVAFVNQMSGTFSPTGETTFTLPEFPQTPPIGWAVSPQQNAIEVEAIVPVEVISAVTAYVSQMMNP